MVDVGDKTTSLGPFGGLLNIRGMELLIYCMVLVRIWIFFICFNCGKTNVTNQQAKVPYLEQSGVMSRFCGTVPACGIM